MPEFMVDLRAKAGVSVRPVEFTILTAARTGEAIGARWSEIDLDKGLWTVPGERMKSGREHSRPAQRSGPRDHLATPPMASSSSPAGSRTSPSPNRPCSSSCAACAARAQPFTASARRSAIGRLSRRPTRRNYARSRLMHALSDQTEAACRYDGEKRRQSPTRRPHIARASFHRRRPDREDGDAPRSVLARRRAHLRPAEAPSRSCRDRRRRIGGGQSHRLSMLSGQSPPRPPTGPHRPLLP